MTDAVIVHGGGRDPIAEEVVAGVRTVLRIQLSDEQRIRIGISGDRDLALCVNRLCDALTEAEEQRAELLAALKAARRYYVQDSRLGGKEAQDWTLRAWDALIAKAEGRS